MMLYGDGREEELSGHMVVELAKGRWRLNVSSNPIY